MNVRDFDIGWSKWFQRSRLSRHKTRESLAQELVVPITALELAEQAPSRLPLEYLAQLATFYGVSINESICLMLGKPPMECLEATDAPTKEMNLDPLS